jgi:hypothetical protein
MSIVATKYGGRKELINIHNLYPQACSSYSSKQEILHETGYRTKLWTTLKWRNDYNNVYTRKYPMHHKN